MKCPRCGFEVGDRVTMMSGLISGRRLVGTVRARTGASCHVVEWDGRPPLATALPNENVTMLS